MGRAILAVEPIRQYVAGIEPIIPNGFAALAVATFLVVLSQAKINVTNATRGSLSWSNFFSRVFCHDICKKPGASTA